MHIKITFIICIGKLAPMAITVMQICGTQSCRRKCGTQLDSCISHKCYSQTA